MKSSELLALFAGNRALKDRLCPLLDSGTLPHALLLTGEDGCGRNFLARLIARSLLADEHDLVGRAAHPDCIVVEGEGASNQITVRRVREAAYELQKSPVMNDCGRVAIIKNAVSLNKSSSNALLKIIEQPPDGVTFLLTARSEAELLETILSRCVRLRVEPLEPQECAEAARALFPTCDAGRLSELCSLYEGRLGLLREVLGAPERLALSDAAGRALKAAEAGDKLGVLSELDCAKTKPELKSLLFDLIMYTRRSLERGGDPALLAALAAECDETAADLDRNGNQKLLCTRFAARLADKI